MTWLCGVQVTGEQLKHVVHEVRGQVTPKEAKALVSKALGDRDQADSDKWQVCMLHPAPLVSTAMWLLQPPPRLYSLCQ